MEAIRPIRCEADYDAALREIEALLETAAPESPDEDRLDVLATLVSAYEDMHYTLQNDVAPIDVLKTVMEDRGYSQADLARVIGSRSRASEILGGKRGLSVEHIRSLREAWGIPADALI